MMPIVPRVPSTLLDFARTLLSVGLLAAGLSACVSSGDIRSTAQTRSPEDLASRITLPGQGGQWPAIDWPTSLGGPALQLLVDEALATNPTLQMSAARIAAAQALADATRAAAGPTVGGSFTSTYQRYTENGIIPPPLAGAMRSDNQLALSVSYDLDFWGRHAAELRAVLAQGKAVEAEQYSARLMLASAVAHSWMQMHRQVQQLALIARQQAVRLQLNDLTARRIAAGLDNQSDNQMAQLQLQNLRTEQAQWQEALALSRNQLAALLGQGPDRGLSIALPEVAPLAALPLPDALPLALLGRRADIVAARWHVEALQGEIESARIDFYPNINLAAFAGLSSLGLPNLINSGSAIAGIGPAIRLPIFEGGALRARLKGKVAGYDSAVATYNQTLTDALHDVADQVQSLRSAAQQQEHQRLAVQAASTVLQLSEQRQRVGTANQLQVLASEAALLQQRRTELDASVRLSDLRVSLIKALGGGFDATASGLAVPVSPSSEISPTVKAAS
ncbi:efflux transporter outer membrane subunit [Actimicrobium sp. CCI2.3]|uniref:efflux transporter outer membrane subunit n=1 Tax=Actimicrobium sp. CCI2.3 TaxID=3048616 RepID=UPI002AB449AF|nr:efflux transporter outer membrane subunit [Actimicrobium sp. CCI2.3]MDY7575542.1 efflux transporter outer membrane subunit [Actimicrobium sp. CCI2.3]MEB0022805.1 efflux transporter outer membrane subunit [Actimicrobium sp. CCI2.3]